MGRADLANRRDNSATVGQPLSIVGDSKQPRTERGRRTLRALLDAASLEFGDRGFHDASISSITQRAGLALGSFYNYFDSKEGIFRALVRDMSDRVKNHVGPHVLAAADEFAAEQAGLRAFIEFVRAHKEIYRIIDEAEFVDVESWRDHYAATAERIHARLVAGAARGEISKDVSEVHAWAIMGMNVFLGLRYGVWSEDMPPDKVAAIAGQLLSRGLGR